MLAMPNIARAQEETFSMVGVIPIPGLASFDISWVDGTIGTYFLADRSNKQIDSYNITTGAIGAFKSANFVGTAVTSSGTVNNDLSGPNGVLTFPNSANSGHTEIWSGDGPQVNFGCPSYLNTTCSSLKVQDFTAGGVLTHVIPTNGAARADELCHDSDHHLVLIANDAEKDFSFGTPFVSWISTDTYQIVAQMVIPQASNGIEQCQYDHATGMFYLNLPEANGPGNDTAPGNVLVISPPTSANGEKATVTATYVIPTADCAGPQGMAIGPDPQLMLGCNAVGPNGVRNSLLINKRTGAVIAIGWGIGGADETWFNPGDSHYYVTGSSATPAQLAVVDAAGPVDQLIPTPTRGGGASHSVAADYNTNKFFVPTGGGVMIFAPSGQDSDDSNIVSSYSGLPE
jgi:hypothetical protein